jgi:hypothetical protein
MDFFQRVLESNELNRHDGRPLWQYDLNTVSYEDLKRYIANENVNHNLARDAALFYAMWWKNDYTGGKPSKQTIFESLPPSVNLTETASSLYELAKRGAMLLGVEWIKRQNTLYFRTLLLQGGLPLKHMSDNHGCYFNFLSAVLDLQPDCVEDFSDRQELISILPVSSRNSVIFESCFAIVNAVIQDRDTYESLFNSNQNLKTINSHLKRQRINLRPKVRLTKPRVYWLLNKDSEYNNIYLHVGLAEKYSNEEMANFLGFEPTQKEYQLYINGNITCVFRRLVNNNEYKTNWYKSPKVVWNGEDVFPEVLVVAQGVTHMLSQFVPVMPKLNSPSLWIKYTEDTWRLVQGNRTESSEAAVIIPDGWDTIRASNSININSNNFQWMPFEGEIEISGGNDCFKFICNTESLNWTIIHQKPDWVEKSNMPIVKGLPRVVLYDTENKRVTRDHHVYFRKHKSKNPWVSMSTTRAASQGCFDLKIVCGDVVAYDTFFNIGNIELSFKEQDLSKAIVKAEKLGDLEFRIHNDKYLRVTQIADEHCLQVTPDGNKVPTSVKASLGHPGVKKLHFYIKNPFKGTRIIDTQGNILPSGKPMNIDNLNGLRILGNSTNQLRIRLSNYLRPEVRITKTVSELQPLIAFDPEIQRLFYLSDSMDYKNEVKLEIHRDEYYISKFTHSLDVSNQLNNRVSLYDSEDELQLFAVPLNCESSSICLSSLVKEHNGYTLPYHSASSQFIVISAPDNAKTLLPRYVNTDADYEGISKSERIKDYHSELIEHGFKRDIWNRLLAYFNICINHRIPFSTFDELRAISVSSYSAAKAFFYIGTNQRDAISFIQKHVIEIELDLGFCFHWIARPNWEKAMNEILDFYENSSLYIKVFELLINYLKENDLEHLGQYISDERIDAIRVSNADIRSLRSRLGERVINELPHLAPRNSELNVLPIMQNENIRLLLQAPIAVAESIVAKDYEYPIWGGDETREKIRRNIQYCQYLDKDFYNKAVLHSINKLTTTT